MGTLRGLSITSSQMGGNGKPHPLSYLRVRLAAKQPCMPRLSTARRVWEFQRKIRVVTGMRAARRVKLWKIDCSAPGGT